MIVKLIVDEFRCVSAIIQIKENNLFFCFDRNKERNKVNFF